MTLSLLSRRIPSVATRRVKLILLLGVCGVNLCAFLGAGLVLYQSRLALQERVAVATRSFAEILDQNISGNVKSIDLTLNAVTDEMERALRSDHRLDARAADTFLIQHEKRLFSGAKIRVSDAGGRVILGDDVVPSRHASWADRDFFLWLKTRPEAGMVITDPIVGRVSNIRVIAFVRRYNHPDGSFAGVVSTAVPLEYFRQILSVPDLGPHGTALLRDAHMGLITRYPPVAGPSGQPGAKGYSRELAEAVASGHAVVTFHSTQTADHIERTDTYRRLSALPFHLVVGLGAQDYMQPWRTEALYVAIGLGGFLLITVSGVLLLYRFLDQIQRETERRRALLLSASDGIHILDANGAVVEASDSFCRMLGYTREEVIGMRVMDWEGRFSANELAGLLAQQLSQSGLTMLETRHRRKDGSVFDVEVSLFPLELDGKPVLYCASRDITARKATEDQLRQLSLAVEQTPESIVITNLYAEIQYVNPAFVENTGYSREEAIGRNPRILNSGKTPPENFVALWDALVQGRSWSGELHNRRKDGSEYLEFAVITPLRQPDGTITHYVAVKQDITERRQQEDDLRQAMRLAESANHAKSRFLAAMSHEIRTPMNGILGMAEMLLMDGLSEADRQDYAHTILTSGESLLSLLNDILDFSKVEEGKLELESRAFDPARLIHETRMLFAETARNKLLGLETGWAGPEDGRYLGDPHRLSQMLSNLVSNALKFTAQGHIRIEAREIDRVPEGAALEFSVSDTGIGIPPEKRSLLFKPFSQTDSSTTRQYGGTGLGLSIVLSLARLMGGEAGVESEAGKGSRFWFRIPARHLAPVPDSPDDVPALRSMPHPAQQKGRILVADDNPTNRKVIKAMLDKYALHSDFAEDGQQAVDRVTGGLVVDLMLMDCLMPKMDGFEATRRIRRWEQDNARPRLTIIALTAGAFEDDRRHCLEAGMDDFLTKPIHVEVLKAMLSRWLRPGTDSGMPGALPAKSAMRDELPVFDEEMLLTQLDDDRELSFSVIQSALEDLPNYFESFDLAIASGDTAEARRKIHTLKSLTGQIGGEKLSSCFKAVDHGLEKGIVPDSRAMRALHEEFIRLLDVLREWQA